MPQGFRVGGHFAELTTATGCAASGTFQTAPRPVIRSVTPSPVCEHGNQVVKFSGDGFVGIPVVYLDGTFQSLFQQLSFGCTPTPGDSSCLALLLGRGDLALGPHTVAIENASTPPIRSVAVTFDVVTGPPFRGRPTPSLVFADGLRKVFVPVVNVTGHVVSSRLISGQIAIAVETVAVPGGAELTIPPIVGRNAFSIEVSDESPCPGDDPSGSFLFTTDNPVVRSLDFDAGTSFAGTDTVTGEEGPAVAWLENQGNPGSAIGASRDGPGPDWYFVLDTGWEGDLDLGLLRFDLRAHGTGTQVSSPAVLLKNFAFQLEHAIPPPPRDGSWVHHEISLASAEGWTYRDTNGSRPAQLADLRSSFSFVRVLGSWFRDAGGADLDNVAVELAR